jgi:hypothetical protein
MNLIRPSSDLDGAIGRVGGSVSQYLSDHYW